MTKKAVKKMPAKAVKKAVKKVAVKAVKKVVKKATPEVKKKIVKKAPEVKKEKAEPLELKRRFDTSTVLNPDIKLPDVTERFLLTNILLQKIQKYFYFPGDNYIVKEIKANEEILAEAEETEECTLLKKSNDALKLIQANSYQGNDFYLNDIISENNKFLDLQ